MHQPFVPTAMSKPLEFLNVGDDLATDIVGRERWQWGELLRTGHQVGSSKLNVFPRPDTPWAKKPAKKAGSGFPLEKLEAILTGRQATASSNSKSKSVEKAKVEQPGFAQQVHVQPKKIMAKL